jgi:hypothetical protein
MRILGAGIRKKNFCSVPVGRVLLMYGGMLE